MNPQLKIRLLSVTAASVVMLAAPGAAGAADFCVLPASGCAPANTFPATGTGVQAALDAAGAAVDSDRVLLGAATYTAPTTGGFSYSHPSAPVQIIGQGSGQTILTGPADSNWVLFLDGGAASVVSDVGLRVPLRVANPSFLEALDMVSSTAERVAVTSDPGLNGASAVVLHDGAFLDGSVTLPHSGPIAGIVTSQSGETVRNTTIDAAKGVLVHGNGFTGDRLRIHSYSGDGIEVLANGAELSDSTITESGGATGAYVSTQNGLDASLRLDHDSLVALGAASGLGIYADAASVGHVASIDAHNTIIRGFAHDRARGVNGAGTSSSITTAYSDYDPAGDVTFGTVPGSTGSISSAGGDINADPTFVDQAGGDLRLGAGSPAIDAGDPAGLLASEPSTDTCGGARLIDGHGNAPATSDIGAYEYHLLPPTSSPVLTGAAIEGQPTTLDGSASADPYGGTLTYSWSFDDGGGAGTAVTNHTWTSDGAHTATLTVTDTCGYTATKALAVAVAAPDSQGPPATSTTSTTSTTSITSTTSTTLPPPATPTAPVLSHLGVTYGHGHGVSTSFALDQRASVSIAVVRRVRGHMSSGRCRPASVRTTRARTCWLMRTIAAQRASAHAGSNLMRLPRLVLKPGHYTIVAQAINAGGRGSASIPLAVRRA